MRWGLCGINATARKLVFILGSPNGADGSLSPISIGRIGRAVALQQADSAVILAATGGFGDHFNKSPTPHRELVHRALLACGARVDSGQPTDLMSANTVEDALTIAAFAEARDAMPYGIVTSNFHVARCRFIFGCVSPHHLVEIYAADEPTDISPDIVRQEQDALDRLVAQGGVIVAGELRPSRR